MNDLVVVGGGFWGTAIAVVASAGGARVSLVDDGAPGGASRAASGYYARGWYKGAWAERVLAAEELGARHGMHVDFIGADVAGVGNRPARTRDDWAVFHPADVLALHEERLKADVRRVEQGRVHLGGGRVLEGRLVVLAAGVQTDRLLAASGIQPIDVEALGGRGLLVGAPRDALARPLMVPVTPYFAYVARQWDASHVRIGETLEKTPSRAHEYARKLRAAVMPRLAGRLGACCVEEGELWGLRPVLPEPTVREVAPGVLVATGGGRVGGMLAWWAAAEVARRL